MKQSAVKTLGVAALGAAFAATAAGSAAAAPSVPDAGAALGLVTHTLPLDEVTDQLPSGTEGALTAGRSSLGTIQQSVPMALTAVQASPAAGLLGGLPIQGAPLGG